ncbi:MAG: hypothetical protein KGL39_50910 [Patescibacteria group bacterium]|nr:hypothetical protein [Patescibacteria group bacterium]
MTFLSNIGTTLVNDFQKAKADFLSFLAKAKTGEQILEADFSAAIAAIALHISTINDDWAKIQQWFSGALPIIQEAAKALPASDQAVLASAIAGAESAADDANLLVQGLDAVATSVNAGNGDVTAVVAGIATVAKASQSTSAVVHALANLPVPTATQTVTQGTINLNA